MDRYEEYAYEVEAQDFAYYCSQSGLDYSDPDSAFAYCDGNKEYEEWLEEQND